MHALGEFSPSGRLFPLGNAFKNYRNNPNEKLLFSTAKFVLNLFYKNGLGYILGVVFTNSSDRPVSILNSKQWVESQITNLFPLQGDRIGPLGQLITLGNSSENDKSSPNFALLFNVVKLMY
jgi:hypothetical protein